MEQLTAQQMNVLVEELTEYLVINLFKGDEPKNWAQETLDWIQNHPAKGWGWKLASILDLHLNGIEVWDDLTAEQRETIAKEIVRYLENREEVSCMFYKDVLLVWKYNDDTRLQAIITFYNEDKYREFVEAKNKRSWLQYELGLKEEYFWNTYIDLNEEYFQEIDNERRLEREVKNADSFVIK